LLGLFAVETAAAYTGRADLLALSITLYAMTPVLLWATVRFGGAGLSLALSATVLIISNAAGRMTPFAGGDPSDAIVGVQLLLTANAVPLMLLAGLLQQNRSEHRALVELGQEQQRADTEAQRDEFLRRERSGDSRTRRHRVRRPDEDGNGCRKITVHSVCTGQPLRRRRRTWAPYAPARVGSSIGFTMCCS